MGTNHADYEPASVRSPPGPFQDPCVDARDKAWGGDQFRRQFNGDNPASATLARQARAADDALVALARSMAKPYPYRFEIRKAAATPSQACPP